MIPKTHEADTFMRFVSHYSRWHRAGGPLANEAVEAIVLRAISARATGMEEDLAVGFAIVSVEYEMQNAPARWRRTGDRALPSIIDRVARFLRRQFAPPIVLCLIAKLAGGKPVDPARSKDDYAARLADLLADRPNLPRAAII